MISETKKEMLIKNKKKLIAITAIAIVIIFAIGSWLVKPVIMANDCLSTAFDSFITCEYEYNYEWLDETSRYEGNLYINGETYSFIARTTDDVYSSDISNLEVADIQMYSIDFIINSEVQFTYDGTDVYVYVESETTTQELETSE